MEPTEVASTEKGCNRQSCVLSVCQTTRVLDTWKLNGQQKLLVDASGLGNLIHTTGLVIDRSVLMEFCKLWSDETNTARIQDFEMAPSLKDAAYILGVPVVGRVVTTGTVVNKSVRDLCLEYLGQIPDSKDCRGSHVKLAWLQSTFGQPSEHPTKDEIMYSTRAYLLCLIGSTLFPEKEMGYVSSKYLPLLSDFEKIREYAWGAAALAHLYKSLSLVMDSSRKRLFGSVTLLMVWIYEYFPMTRPDMEDAPASIFPRARRWRGNTTSKPTKDVSDMQDACSMLRVSDINWEPYKDLDPASIPQNCIAPDNFCFSRSWLISFNIREIYVPERYARQFGKVQQTLDIVPKFKRHQWRASEDWSHVFASDIEQFQQLNDAAHYDDTTVNTTCNMEEFFTPVATTHASHGLSLKTTVEDIKKEFSVIERFLMQQPLPVEVASAVARINDLVGSSHLKGSDAPLDAQTEGSSEPHGLAALDLPFEPAREQESTVMLHDIVAEAAPGVAPDEVMQNDDLTSKTKDLDTEAAPGVAPDEAMQSGNLGSSIAVAECTDVPRETAALAREGSEDSESEEHSADESDCWEKKRRLPPVERGGEPLRRSNRHCVQIKRFKHRGGKGSKPSDPIVL